MMRATRTISMLVAFYLLATAATAYAECAWVLWRETLPTQFPEVPDWQIMQAHPTVKECSRDLVDLALMLKRDGNRVEGAFPDSRTATVTTKQDKGYLMCLPDTVDPRGPKGK